MRRGFAGPNSIRIAAVLAAVGAGVLVPNLFGFALREFFLRYPGIDKILHIVGYLTVVLVVHRALAASALKPDTRAHVAAAAAVLLGFLDESAQQFAPGRTFETADLAANLSGTVIGWMVAWRPSVRVALPAAMLAGAVGGLVTWHTHVIQRDYSLALRYERGHDFERALEHYRRAVTAGLRGSQVYNGLAWVAVESGTADPEEAVQYARQALELEPDNADVLDTYGWALHYSGRSAEALEPLRQAFEKKPNMFCIHYHLGSVYLALARPADAEVHFRKQLELKGTREAVMAARALDLIAR